MTAAAIKHIPKLEKTIMEICEVVFSKKWEPWSDSKPPLERIMPTLSRWKETEKECQNLAVFKRKIIRILGDQEGSLSDQEAVSQSVDWEEIWVDLDAKQLKRIKELMSQKEKAQEMEVKSSEAKGLSKQEQKFIEHFKRLFDVDGDEMLIIKLHQIYSNYHKMESRIHQVTN